MFECTAECFGCRCTNRITRLLKMKQVVPVRCVKQISIVCFDVVDFHQFAELLDFEDVTSCFNELVTIFRQKCADMGGVFRPRTFDQTLLAVFGNVFA